tara:strand:+ start:3 stop:1094 length:1092 start_codon:yes stop_codon:yes gene_type:complete
MITFKIYDNLNQPKVQEIISYLYEKNNNLFFQSNLFLNNCNNIYLNNKSKIYIILLFDEEKPILAAPVYIEEKYKIKILKWLSCETIDFNIPICDYKILYSNFDEINVIFFQALNTLSYDLIKFDKFPEFVLRNKNLFLTDLLSKYSDSYYFDSSEDLDNFYLNNTNSKTKQTDRRKLKKILSEKKLNLEKIILNKDNFESFEELVNLKYNQYFSKNLKSFNPNKIIEFYFNIIIKDKKNFSLVIHKMKIENTDLSIIFGIEQFNYFYYLIPYVPNTPVFKYSPGRFHIKELIKIYQKKKMNVDFTSGDENYKKNWSNCSYDMNYILKMNNLKGLPLYIYFILYYRLRKNQTLKKILHFIKIK